MKDARNQNNKQSKQPMINNNKPRPEVRDNLDSRGDLELNDQKAGHNEKELHEGEKNEHNDPQGTKRKK